MEERRRRMQGATFPQFDTEGCCATTSFNPTVINNLLTTIQNGIDSLLVVNEFALSGEDRAIFPVQIDAVVSLRCCRYFLLPSSCVEVTALIACANFITLSDL